MDEKNKPKYLIFLGTNYNSPILQIEQYLPLYLSRHASVVCFEYPQFNHLIKIITGEIPLIEKKGRNLIIFHSFGLLPFGRTIIFINFVNHLISFIILRLLFIKNTSRFNIITFTPEVAFLKTILKNRHIFYYILDNYLSLPWWNNSFSRIQLNILEYLLFKYIRKIFVVTDTLKDKYSKRNLEVNCFPTPANIQLFITNFQRYKNSSLNLKRLTSIKKPIVGFIGTIAEWKMDLKLLELIANKFTSASFVLLGLMSIKDKSIRKTLLSKLNIFYVGHKPLEDIPTYISDFNVCIIPYLTNDYGQYAYPVKIMEYLSLGKPVVTTALPSIKYLDEQGLIYWSKSSNDFIKNLKLALEEKNSQKLIRKRVSEAKKNDWSVRIKEFIRILEEKQYE